MPSPSVMDTQGWTLHLPNSLAVILVTTVVLLFIVAPILELWPLVYRRIQKSYQSPERTRLIPTYRQRAASSSSSNRGDYFPLTRKVVRWSPRAPWMQGSAWAGLVVMTWVLCILVGALCLDLTLMLCTLALTLVGLVLRDLDATVGRALRSARRHCFNLYDPFNYVGVSRTDSVSLLTTDGFWVRSPWYDLHAALAYLRETSPLGSDLQAAVDSSGTSATNRPALSQRPIPDDLHLPVLVWHCIIDLLRSRLLPPSDVHRVGLIFDVLNKYDGDVCLRELHKSIHRWSRGGTITPREQFLLGVELGSEELCRKAVKRAAEFP